MNFLRSTGFILALIGLAALPATFYAASTPAPAFQVLPGQRIMLKGDSIVRGHATGNYTDPTPLRTLAGIANLLLAENLTHRPPVAALPKVWDGLKPDGTPKTVDTLGAELHVNVQQGDLRVGDWLIYEDAGELDHVVHPAPWPTAQNMYARQREALRTLVLEADKTVGRDHVLFMTMFDYQPKTPWCEWDAPLDDGVHTGNDAIRDEAATLGVRVIDMNRIMDRASKLVGDQGWGRLVGPDGIHPNVVGNYVMTLAILGSLGADIGSWKIDSVERVFRHPAAGGHIATILGFTKDPTDAERRALLIALQQLVAEEVTAAAPGLARVAATPAADLISQSAHHFTRLIRHGRILGQAVKQPVGTTRPASYELGTVLQLDPDHCLLLASLREEGGHDFAIGNDGFVFSHLADIVPERAIPLNRLEPDRPLKSGAGTCVLGKFPVTGAFVPLGALLPDGTPHPAAGTGFLISTSLPFLPDRSQGHPGAGPDDRPNDLIQLKWDGKELKVTKREEFYTVMGKSIARVPISNLVAQDRGFLCPYGPSDGSFIMVVRYDWDGTSWQITKAGRPFITAKNEDVRDPGLGNASWVSKEANPGVAKGAGPEDDGKKVSHAQKLPAHLYRHLEVMYSMFAEEDHYILHTRGDDKKGRIYRSDDGLNYTLQFDHPSELTPQILNQGLDGSVYLATNSSKGYIRNPLLVYAVSGHEVKDPIVVHDEKFIRTVSEGETPFVDHGRQATVLLEGRWRSFLLYRVCDLRETNGQGRPPGPQTGLYLAEFEYAKTTVVPYRFAAR